MPVLIAPSPYASFETSSGTTFTEGAQWDDLGVDKPLSVDPGDGYDLVLTSATQGYTY